MHISIILTWPGWARAGRQALTDQCRPYCCWASAPRRQQQNHGISMPMAQFDPQRNRDAASSGSELSSAPRSDSDLSAGWRGGSSAACPGHGAGDARSYGASPAFTRSESPTLREGCHPATRRARGHLQGPDGVCPAAGAPAAARKALPRHLCLPPAPDQAPG